jgi:chorismate mutase/prephenate dehydratase
VPPPDLATLRASIDHIDHQLVALLNQRATLVVDVGKSKRATGVPIYAPHRESQVLKRVLGLNDGPLRARSIEGIYREIMSASFSLEKGLTIGYLGPAGSFSHLAAVRHFGSSVQFQNLREIDGVFTEVQRGHVDYGLVPIENSIHGGIAETLDSLARSTVSIYAEAQLEVRHALLANIPPSAVRTIYSKPEAFSQCRHWLATQYPDAKLVPTASSSHAVELVAKGPKPGAAAIGSTLAAELYDVRVLFEGIQDRAVNITRFFILGRGEGKPSGDDKTSVMFTTLNKPGALAAVLTEFQRARVNLTHIDKRPSGRTNWTYTFFVDAEGHRTDAKVVKALAGARRHCKDLVVLGSYPRSRRIL